MEALNLPLFLIFLFMSVVLILRYFIFSGIFHHFFKTKNKSVQFSAISKDIRRSIESSLIFALISTLFIFLLREGYTKIYFDFSEYPWWYGPISLLLFLLLQDTYFYWSHRLMHLYSLKKYHFAHHESRNPTAWTSFAFHPVEALIQAIFIPIFVLLIPMHLFYLFLGLTIMTLFGITNHLGYEIYPSVLEKKFFIITSNHHLLHHQKVNKNFGLFFTFWDHWANTEYKEKLDQ